jgi:hypothetical protein
LNSSKGIIFNLFLDIFFLLFSDQIFSHFIKPCVPLFENGKYLVERKQTVENKEKFIKPKEKGKKKKKT